MAIAGIIGGVGPESTIDYYRSIVATYRARSGDGSYPRLIINCVDLSRALRMLGGGHLDHLTKMLVDEIAVLARAGADFAIVSANTPHVVFNAVCDRSALPLISIVEVTCEAARARGLKRPALIGTRYTMQGTFYPDVFHRAGLEIVTPAPDDQERIHGIYVGELIEGIFRPESRDTILAIARRLRAEQRIDSLILGGTELPLLLRGAEDADIPFLDTTQLHVDALVARMLG